MKRLSLLLALILASLSLVSCEYGLWEFLYHGETVQTRAENLTELNDAGTSALVSHLNSKASSGTYKFLVITDIHFGKPNKDRRDEDLYEWLDSNGSGIDFCVNLGDTADHGLPSELDNMAPLESAIKTRCPNFPAATKIYNILGNHDLYNSGWTGWKEKMYPNTSFYHFKTNGMSYYFLDSGSATLGKPQYNRLKKAFASDPLPKIVMTHYPVYADSSTVLGYFTMQNSEESSALISLFAQYNVILVLDGHTHKYFKADLGKFVEFNTPSLVDNVKWSVVTVNEAAKTASAELVAGKRAR
ncbi:MAG TPA: hypothetical protein DEO40_05865 [Treponema sp.]|nr:hypothetical protein [Treponema sp.]HCA20183.1 hypothetical protein [Treponema sp.]